MMNNPMMNPNAMTGMLKNNLFMFIFTPLQYAVISHFFSGFIIGKVPFPLTQKFRGMLQSGVSVVGLDVKYISSLSLYFLTIFGFSSIYKMLFSQEDDDFSNPMKQMNPMMMNPMMAPGANPMGGQPKQEDLLKKEIGKFFFVIFYRKFDCC